jgi:hypothetical protein
VENLNPCACAAAAAASHANMIMKGKRSIRGEPKWIKNASAFSPYGDANTSSIRTSPPANWVWNFPLSALVSPGTGASSRDYNDAGNTPPLQIPSIQAGTAQPVTSVTRNAP